MPLSVTSLPQHLGTRSLRSGGDGYVYILREWRTPAAVLLLETAYVYITGFPSTFILIVEDIRMKRLLWINAMTLLTLAASASSAHAMRSHSHATASQFRCMAGGGEAGNPDICATIRCSQTCFNGHTCDKV